MGELVKLHKLRKMMEDILKRRAKALYYEIEVAKINKTESSREKLLSILRDEIKYIKKLDSNLSRLKELIINGAWYLIMEYSSYIYAKYRAEFLHVYKKNPDISIYEFVEEKVKSEEIDLEGIPASYSPLQGYSSCAHEELILTIVEEFIRLVADYEA